MPKLQSKDTLTAQEAADLLGIHINTLYKYAQAGELKAVKYFGRYIFSKSQLIEWRENRLKEITK